MDYRDKHNTSPGTEKREAAALLDTCETPSLGDIDRRSQYSSGSRSFRIDHTLPRQRLRLRLLLPTLAVVLGTAGFAILLIIWLLTHKTQASLSEVYKQRAFLLNEGTKVEGDIEAGRLIGLTITSAASSAIGFFTPILMSLYAYRTAFSWILSKENNLPSPLQYGLILDALGGAGIVSLGNTGNYFYKTLKAKRSIPPMLTEAFCVATLSYMLVHAVSGVDLWLHAVTSTIIDATETPSILLSNYSYTQGCPPYPTFGPCLWNAGGWHGDRPLSMIAVSNRTDELRAITLSDAEDIAVVVDPTVPQGIAFTAVSFGARAKCQSLNSLCGFPDNFNNSCPGFPSTFPPANNSSPSTPGGPLNAADSSLFMLTSTCATCEHIQLPSINTIKSPDNATSTNYSLWLQIVWEGREQYLYRNVPGGAVSVLNGGATMLTNCSVAFYNVTLGYKNGSYTLVDEEIANTGMSDGMSSPMRLGFFASNLISDIEGIAFSTGNSDVVMTALSQSLARFAISSAAVVIGPKVATLTQSTLGTRILGRYPFWPVATIVILLFANAAFALLICIATAFSRTEEIEVPGQEKPVSTLDLAKLRLTSHVALTAELFPGKVDGGRRPDLSVMPDSMAMHEESEQTTVGIQRVRIGLHKDDGNGRTVFGLWRNPEA